MELDDSPLKTRSGRSRMPQPQVKTKGKKARLV